MEVLEAKRYMAVWTKVLSLLEARGLATDTVVKTESDFSRVIQAGETMVGGKFPKGEGENQLVVLHLGGSLTVKSATQIASQINHNRTLIVYRGSITGQAKDLLAQTQVAEVIEEADFLRLEKPESILTVSLLNEEEQRQMMTLFNITEEMIPEEYNTSDLAKFYGLLPGDIVKINETREEHRFVTFRRIIRK